MLVQAARAEPLTRDSLDAAPEYIAAVRASDETEFSFKVGGVVELIGPEPGKNWDEGTAVPGGKVLARLKQADFTNALVSAKAKEALATATLNRFVKLRETDAISQQELDTRKADAESASAQLAQAEMNLADSELRATWDGVVLARYVNPGETVAAGKPVVRFADTRLMSVELGLPDRLVGHFSAGQAIEVGISSMPGHPPYQGYVSEVGVAAAKEGRLFRVVIKVKNSDGLLRSGMTATVRVGELAQTPPDSVLVPVSALVTAPATGAGPEQHQLAVFAVRDGKAVLCRVHTGDIVKSSIIVTEGIKAGETVVTSGASLLYDGAPVEVLRREAAGT